MAESLTISATLLFKSTETRRNKVRLAQIVRNLRASLAATNDSKCVLTQLVGQSSQSELNLIKLELSCPEGPLCC